MFIQAYIYIRDFRDRFERFPINVEVLKLQVLHSVKNHCRNMAEAELLGAGLDIEGWSFIKNEVQGKINEMTDRHRFILSNSFF